LLRLATKFALLPSIGNTRLRFTLLIGMYLRCVSAAAKLPVFAKEFSRRELFARRIGMPLSPAEPKWAALYNANVGAEQQRLNRVVVRVLDSNGSGDGK
jgi:hypothetical protein